MSQGTPTPTTTTPGHGPRVFICHSRNDADGAAALYDFLKSRGATPWLDTKNVGPGEEPDRATERAVGECDAFVVCLSRHFNRAGYREPEVQWAHRALERRVAADPNFVIPFLMETIEVEHVPAWCPRSRLGQSQSPTAFDELWRTISQHCGLAVEPAAPKTSWMPPALTRILDSLHLIPRTEPGTAAPLPASEDARFLREEDGVTVFTPHGLKGEAVGALTRLTSRVKPLKIRRVVIDLGSLTEVSTHGLAGLIMLKKTLDEAHGVLVVARPAPYIHDVIKLTKLDKMLTVTETFDEAMAIVKAHTPG